ncbi:MAG TPA: BCAM0308 family protein [Candidatus Obscuribacterales bacterium]
MSKTVNPTTAALRSSKKQRAPEIGHTQDRLPADRRLAQKNIHEPGTSVCTRCTAICHDKHWYIDPNKLKSLARDPEVRQVMCPGCERVEKRMYDGEVVLESDLLVTHRDACLALIKHTEGKAWHDNPLSRIATMHENGKRIELLTTTRWLAMRLGKQFYKSFKGNLEIKPSHREKFVRVYWSR